MLDAQRPIAATSPASRSNVESYASAFARMRRSIPSSRGSSLTLTSSLRRRFTRFRSTTFRLCFGTTTPTRGCSNREADARASRSSVCIRFPVRLTLSRSVSLLSLACRGKASRLRAGVFRRQLDSEPFTSLLAAAAKDFTTPFSSHTQPKTMSANPALITGTVGRLAHYYTPETRKSGYGKKPLKLFQH